MNTLFEYIKWRGDLSFEQSPLNEVDNLILSKLSYLPFDQALSTDFSQRFILREVGQQVLDQLQDPQGSNGLIVLFDQDPLLLEAMVQSRRFGELEVFGFRNHVDPESQKQICGMTIRLAEDLYFVSFRGTDNTFVGWKEDFNMTLQAVVPSQLEAVRYVDELLSQIEGDIYVGGHSKGGNLAIYAGVFVQQNYAQRVLKIFSNDGPGFHSSVLASEKYQQNRHKIYAYIPEESIVGLLFEHDANITIIKSKESMFWQHDPYNWVVEQTQFVHVSQLSRSSRFIDTTIKQWAEGLEPLKQRQTIDVLFEILNATEVTSLSQITEDWFKKARMMIGAYSQYDKETRKMMMELLGSLFSTGRKNLSILRKKNEETIEQENDVQVLETPKK